MINYSLPVTVDGNPGFFLRADTVVVLGVPYYVNYVTYGPTLDSLLVSPFNEWGVAYTTAEIAAFGLSGVESETFLINSPVGAFDTFYVRKEGGGFFPVSSLDEVRSAYDILGTKPQGVARIVITSTDGLWGTVSAGTEVLNIDSVLGNPYLV